MTIKNHYGVYVDTSVSTTGVATNNQIEWLGDEIYSGIDLDYETALAEFESDPEAFFTKCCIPESDQVDFDLGEYMSMSGTPSTYLIGTWNLVDGKYEPNTTGEFAAIVGEVYTQVVHSQWVTRAPLCSPCYPGQASVDCDGDGGEQLTYTLPPDVWGDTLTNEEKSRVRLETAIYHYRQFIKVVELWLSGKAKITDVKAVKESSKVILDKINKLGQQAKEI